MLMGVIMDPKKSLESDAKLAVLGSEVLYEYYNKSIYTRLDSVKASKWSEDLQKLVLYRKFPVNVQKLAGRLSSTITAAFDRIGRAYVKPFYAQINDPRAYPSPMLVAAAEWWVAFLGQTHPKEWFRILAQGRPCVTLWTDASGVSRGLGAVLRREINGQEEWLYTDMVLPQTVWDQLIDRSDHQIQFQEFAAVALALSSFDIDESLIVVFIDNNSVLHSVLKGSAKLNQELNNAIGKLWLHMSQHNIAPFFLRVESKANVADDPSRGCTKFLDSLGAKRVQPILPKWFYQVWSLDA